MLHLYFILLIGFFFLCFSSFSSISLSIYLCIDLFTNHFLFFALSFHLSHHNFLLLSLFSQPLVSHLTKQKSIEWLLFDLYLLNRIFLTSQYQKKIQAADHERGNTHELRCSLFLTPKHLTRPLTSTPLLSPCLKLSETLEDRNAFPNASLP